MAYVDSGLIQVAGDIGLLSLGLEKKFSRYSLGGLYGFVPSEVSGGPVIETVTLRQTYRFCEWERLGFYGGLNVFHVLGLNYQSDKFKDAPDSYYALGGVRALLNLGINVDMKDFELSAFYFEAGINDVWLTNYLSNSDEINPFEHITLGIGLKKDF